jgi:hypothetical protein
MMKVEDRP